MIADAPGEWLAKEPLALDARAVLLRYESEDRAQTQLRGQFLATLEADAGAMWRDGPPGHFTASAFVFDADLDKVCLVLHKKAGLWLQPGGHFEGVDQTVASAALREATEETGLPGLIAGTELVDLSHHALNSMFGRCRTHLDLRFAFIDPSGEAPQVSDESDDVRWWPVEALPDHTDDALRRTIPAVRDRFQLWKPSAVR